MAQQYDNPFQNLMIISPEMQRETYDFYCQAGQSAKPDVCPFPRKVDLWFASLALAARKKLDPIDLNKKKVKTADIISGSVFNTDGWQAQAIMLIAIAVKGSLEVVLNPREMMDIANGLAAAGVPHIEKMLNDGSHKPIWNLSDAIEKLLQSDPVTEEQSDHTRLAEALQ